MPHALTVNLDAMILREDLVARKGHIGSSYESISTISTLELDAGNIRNYLRKPDFQRETNHWKPQQIASLVECYVNGDLIPSVILWQSDSFLFVIDGGHRLSALIAWIADDYGDGDFSNKFFGNNIPIQQKRMAEATRKLINGEIGSYQDYKAKITSGKKDVSTATIVTRGMAIQWVKGNVDKAEMSFFKINTQGTALDEVEESLLRYRKYPIPISARAVIRSGYGHKYWSSFKRVVGSEIETISKDLSKTLFEPEINSPIKTLNLPLAGSRGIRDALQILIEYFSIANEIVNPKPLNVEYLGEDNDGSNTVKVLKSGLKLARRITGSDPSSLGLHPAVYFYGPRGVHSLSMFLGTARLFSRKIADNNKTFFGDFTKVRERLESILIKKKDLIATILQKVSSRKRVIIYERILAKCIDELLAEKRIRDAQLIDWGGVVGKVIVGTERSAQIDFSDEIKSETFISGALKSALQCPICKGYLDEKSLSYDHKLRVRSGGKGGRENCQITHHFCNTGIKA